MERVKGVKELIFDVQATALGKVRVDQVMQSFGRIGNGGTYYDLLFND